MSPVQVGSCLCGAVRFRVEGAFERFYLCHCSRCRKDTGSAHAANLFSTTARLVWLSGEADVRTFRLAGTQHERSFCLSCGSALPGRLGGEGVLVVPAGSLDGPVDIRPDAHICMASRATWEQDLDRLPGFEALPD
jgi:hypothetical protein